MALKLSGLIMIRWSLFKRRQAHALTCKACAAVIRKCRFYQRQSITRKRERGGSGEAPLLACLFVLACMRYWQTDGPRRRFAFCLSSEWFNLAQNWPGDLIFCWTDPSKWIKWSDGIRFAINFGLHSKTIQAVRSHKKAKGYWSSTSKFINIKIGNGSAK